jgi:hypothetical protein
MSLTAQLAGEFDSTILHRGAEYLDGNTRDRQACVGRFKPTRSASGSAFLLRRERMCETFPSVQGKVCGTEVSQSKAMSVRVNFA